MSREFSVGADGLTVASAALTGVFVTPPVLDATHWYPNIDVMRIWASQAGTAQSGQQRVQVVTQVSVFPTLGTGATPRHIKMNDNIASIIVSGTTGSAGLAGVNASSEGTGTKTVMWGDNFNVLNGYLWVATPREIISMPPQFSALPLGGLGLYLAATPSTTSNWGFGMNYSEGTP